MENTIEKPFKNRGKENLVFSFYLSNHPIGQFKDYVVLMGELYRYDNISDCITTSAYMDTDMYLDLILEKNNFEGIEGDFIFTSGVIGNFKKLSKPDRERVINLNNGILGVYKKEEFKILKEIV